MNQTHVRAEEPELGTAQRGSLTSLVSRSDGRQSQDFSGVCLAPKPTLFLKHTASGGAGQPANAVRYPPSQPASPHSISATAESPGSLLGLTQALHVTATWGHSCQHHLEWSGTHEHIMWGGGAQGALSPRGLCPGQWLGCWAAHLSLLSCPGRSEPFSTACGIPGAPGSLCPPSGHLLACSAHGPGHKPPLSLGVGGYLWVGGQDPCTCRPRFPEASSPEKEQAGGEGGGALGPGSPAQPSKEHFGHTETGSLPFWVWSAEPAQGRLSTPLRGFQLQRVPIVLCSMGPVSQRFGTDTPLSLTI